MSLFDILCIFGIIYFLKKIFFSKKEKKIIVPKTDEKVQDILKFQEDPKVQEHVITQEIETKKIEVVKAEPKQLTKEELEKNKQEIENNFQKKYNIIFQCNGLLCNPYYECNLTERYFCQKFLVPLKTELGVDFSGQYQFTLKDKKYRVDFLIQIEPESNHYIVIELDSYNYHIKDVNLEKQIKSFERNNDLASQNILILRFNFDQLKEYPDLCYNQLKKAICEPTPYLPIKQKYLTVYYNGEDEKEFIKDLQCTYSSVNNKYVIPYNITTSENIASMLHMRVKITFQCDEACETCPKECAAETTLKYMHSSYYFCKKHGKSISIEKLISK